MTSEEKIAALEQKIEAMERRIRDLELRTPTFIYGDPPAPEPIYPGPYYPPVVVPYIVGDPPPGSEPFRVTC